jgi:hypothetical protein
MAVLLTLSVLIAGVSSAVTTAVTLHIHIPQRHYAHVLSPEERFLQHKPVHWSRPEQWQ